MIKKMCAFVNQIDSKQIIINSYIISFSRIYSYKLVIFKNGYIWKQIKIATFCNFLPLIDNLNVTTSIVKEWCFQKFMSHVKPKIITNDLGKQVYAAAQTSYTLINILYKQKVTDCPAALMTLAAVRKLHLWNSTQIAQSNGGAANVILLIFWKKALATLWIVNLASQFTVPTNNLTAYAALWGIFHSV